MNPNAEEFQPKQPLAVSGSSSVTEKSCFAYNPDAAEYGFSSSLTPYFVDRGILGVEEDCTPPTYPDENGNNLWLVSNPQPSENETPSGSSLNGGVVVYEPWYKNGFECHEMVFNPDASEFIPSYKDSISENDRGHHPIHRNTVYTDNEQFRYSLTENDQQFLHSNNFEDQQGLVRPVYFETEPKLVYSENPENYQRQVHQMIYKTDQHLIYDTTSPKNDVHYNMDWCQRQQPSYFPDESNEISDWSAVNVNQTGFGENEPYLPFPATDPSEEEYHYPETVTYSPSQQPPPPLSHAPPEYSYITIAPLYVLIGVQPHKPKPKKRVTFRLPAECMGGGEQLIVTTPLKLSPVDSTNEGTASQESLIPLTQVLISQRPPRSHAEQRKSQSWTATGESRSSIISVNSLEFPRQNNSYPSEPGSRTSVTSPESGIDGEAESSDETAPPPVPPKQRDKHSDNKPPTPPPKPPMRYFRDVPQP